MTPAPGLGFSRDNNTVTLRMDIDDWQTLLFLIGLAAASDKVDAAGVFLFANRLNEGNPNWTQYRVEVAP